jgi:hypothetical protein
MEPYAAPSVIPAPPSPPAAIADEADNTDVLALRSAVGLLQLQREAARRDIRTLDGMRRAALEDPEGYVRALLARTAAKNGGRAAEREGGDGDADLLAPTIRHLQAALGSDAPGLQPPPASGMPNTQAGAEDDGMYDDEDEEMEDAEDTVMPDAAAQELPPASAEGNGDDDARRFPAPPRAQNVYRMPPINWSKYQVVGTALDRLHEEQRARPAGGAPTIAPLPAALAPDAGAVLGALPRHELAAPYRPGVDTTRYVSPAVAPGPEHPMQTRRGSRRVGS